MLRLIYKVFAVGQGESDGLYSPQTAARILFSLSAGLPVMDRWATTLPIQYCRYRVGLRHVQQGVRQIAEAAALSFDDHGAQLIVVFHQGEAGEKACSTGSPPGQ